MSELDEIRRRDRAAIPRLGDPDNDPLLRAEMDRRFLLAELDSMKAYGADLIRQRAEHDVARTEAETRISAVEAVLDRQWDNVNDLYDAVSAALIKNWENS